VSWEDGHEIRELKDRLNAAEARLEVHRMAIAMLAEGLHLDAADAMRAAERRGAERSPK